MSNPLQQDFEVDSFASKIATLFHLNSSEVKDVTFDTTAEFQVFMESSGTFTGEKYLNTEKCATSLTAI